MKTSQTKKADTAPDANRHEKPLSRRSFLKLGGAAIAGTAGLLGAKHVVGGDGSKTTKRLAMVIDLRRCFGCHACSVACKAQFDVPLGVWRSWVIVSEKGKYPNVSRQFLPVLCNHCENTPCLKGCPAIAITRSAQGIVEQNEDRCIGCGYCLQNCPYKMRFTHPEKHVAQKCNFCSERLKQGLEPACVNTCNAKARIFGDLNDPNSEVSKLIATNPVKVLLPEQNTQPKVFYIGLDDGAYKKRFANPEHI